MKTNKFLLTSFFILAAFVFTTQLSYGQNANSKELEPAVAVQREAVTITSATGATANVVVGGVSNAAVVAAQPSVSTNAKVAVSPAVTTKGKTIDAAPAKTEKAKSKSKQR